MICTRSPSRFLTEQEPDRRPPNPEPSVTILLEFLHHYDDQGIRKHPHLTPSFPHFPFSQIGVSHRSILLDLGSYSHGKQACANAKARHGEATHTAGVFPPWVGKPPPHWAQGTGAGDTVCTPWRRASFPQEFPKNSDTSPALFFSISFFLLWDTNYAIPNTKYESELKLFLKFTVFILVIFV